MASTAQPNEDGVTPWPNLKLAQIAFSLSQSPKDADALKAELMAGIEADGKLNPQLDWAPSRQQFTHSLTHPSHSRAEMGPYLKALLAEPATRDMASGKSDVLSTLEAKNKAELESIEAKLADAETNLGETEISDALKAKAAYLARIGDKVSQRVMEVAARMCQD